LHANGAEDVLDKTSGVLFRQGSHLKADGETPRERREGLLVELAAEGVVADEDEGEKRAGAVLGHEAEQVDRGERDLLGFVEDEDGMGRGSGGEFLETRGEKLCGKPLFPAGFDAEGVGDFLERFGGAQGRADEVNGSEISRVEFGEEESAKGRLAQARRGGDEDVKAVEEGVLDLVEGLIEGVIAEERLWGTRGRERMAGEAEEGLESGDGAGHGEVLSETRGYKMGNASWKEARGSSRGR
jgi:hypothetical protein